MRKKLIILFVIGWTVLAAVTMVAALAYGRYERRLDFVHVYYGLPLTWGVNQLRTVTGPMNAWSVDSLNFLVDVVFWLAIFLAPLVLMGFKPSLTCSKNLRL
jgi:hypothetical protein